MPDEFDIIRQYFAPLSMGASGAFALSDDAAVLTPAPGFETVVTTDAIVAGVHFLADDAPENIAAKLAGSNLSDLAAMGARPVGFTLACAWPKDTAHATIQAFAEGLRPFVDDFKFPLLGGDTVSTPGPLTLSLTALGEVEAGKALRRSGAKPGNAVFVTGTIGDAALGLMVAQGELGFLAGVHKAHLDSRYRRPIPRVGAGRRLIDKARACIDISDGLAQDLGHIARTSGVEIVIDADKIPLSDAARAALDARPDMLGKILGGGDDYELCFTAAEMPGGLGVPVTAIGTVESGTGQAVFLRNGSPLPPFDAGYKHF